MNGVLVGRAAPEIVGKTVMGNNETNESFSLTEYRDGKGCVLLFYPLDFTFVCPTEIIAADNRYGEFLARGFKVVAISVDSHFTHIAWKNTPINKGGIGNVQFPMVADITKSISRDYGVLIGDAVSLRATFIIDKKGIVRHQLVNDLPLGRNIDETLRMVDALQYFEEHGEVCPAGWSKGDPAITATSEGIADFLRSNADKL